MNKLVETRVMQLEMLFAADRIIGWEWEWVAR